MCLFCTTTSDGRGLARRVCVLQLLGILEDGNALPADTALRIAGKILTLADAEGPELRCDAAIPPDTNGDDDTDRGLQ